jgi:hypothetical protein
MTGKAIVVYGCERPVQLTFPEAKSMAQHQAALQELPFLPSHCTPKLEAPGGSM